MEFLDEEARGAPGRAGADVKRGPTASCASTAGSSRARRQRACRVHAARPQSRRTTSRFGGDRIVFAHGRQRPQLLAISTAAAGPAASRLPRPARLGQSLNIIHFIGGYPVEPIDLPPATRHLDAHPTCDHADRQGLPRLFARAAAHRDGIEMTRIARGIDREQLAREPSLFTDRQHQLAAAPRRRRCRRASWRWRAPARRGASRPSPSPAPWRRSRSPARWRSRTPRRWPASPLPSWCGRARPCIYGGFTSNVDMKSGAPAFGTPEYMKAALAGGQLARRYSLPYRSSQRLRRQRGRRPGGLRIGDVALGRGDGRRQPGHARRRLDGGRARAPRSRSWSSTPRCCR